MQYLSHLAPHQREPGRAEPVTPASASMEAPEYYLGGSHWQSVSDTWMEYLQRGGGSVCPDDVYRSLTISPDTSPNFWPYLPSHIGFSSIHEKHITRLGVRTASAVAAMVFVANAAWP